MAGKKNNQLAAKQNDAKNDPSVINIPEQVREREKILSSIFSASFQGPLPPDPLKYCPHQLRLRHRYGRENFQLCSPLSQLLANLPILAKISSLVAARGIVKRVACTE